jgi:hypothetical protein
MRGKAMTSGKQSPQKLAKEWAKRNPERTVKIDVLSLVPKGRGGKHGLGQRTNTFYAHGGVLKKVGDIYADEDPTLVIIDLQCDPHEIVEIETTRCFYYRVDGVMTIWQRTGGENKKILPSKTYELLTFLNHEAY